MKSVRARLRPGRAALVAATAVSAVLLGAPAAHAVQRLVVDDDRHQCPQATYTRIQAAVAAAPAGATILVCPGTYREQVTVGAGKDGLALVSTTPRAAVITAPATLRAPGAIVHVRGARGVSVRDFTVAGPLPDARTCPATPRSGMRVGGGGSATINGNLFQEIREATPVGPLCEDGIAVLVGRQADGDVGAATVAGNTLRRYQEGGVTVSGAGSRAEVLDNSLLGIGPTARTAQSGVRVSEGAWARVARNDVRNHQTLADCCSAPGVYLSSPAAGTEVVDNLLSRNDDNVVLEATRGARVATNRITDSTLFDGIFADDASRGNTLYRNVLRGNMEHDCHDESAGAGTAGTANRWIENTGSTAQPPGLCRPY